MGVPKDYKPSHQPILPIPANGGLPGDPLLPFYDSNTDFFNVLNNPGIGQPSNSSGIISLQNSANAPRELQLSLRLTF